MADTKPVVRHIVVKGIASDAKENGGVKTTITVAGSNGKDVKLFINSHRKDGQKSRAQTDLETIRPMIGDHLTISVNAVPYDFPDKKTGKQIVGTSYYIGWMEKDEATPENMNMAQAPISNPRAAVFNGFGHTVPQSEVEDDFLRGLPVPPAKESDREVDVMVEGVPF